MRYALTEIPICAVCMAASSPTKVCVKCSREFCAHYASVIDLQYCTNCMEDVQIEVYKKRDYKNIKLNGTDFYFAERVIPEMSDAQIDVNIEYYSAMLSGLILEKQERKIERQTRLSKIQVKLNNVGPAPTPKKRAKAQPDLKAILTAMMGHEPSQAEIDAFIKLAGGTK